MKSIIFHHPLPLSDNPKSGSQIRPIRMLEAFKNLGYEVDLVVGYSAERKKSIESIQQKILSGKKYDFVYCENSTMPTQLTDPNHFPIRPFLDFDFFKFLKRNNVPIGLFYRDIHWKYPHYTSKVSFLKRTFSKLFYYYELIRYKHLIDILYLPSNEMKKYIPIINSSNCIELPPAHNNYCYIKNDIASNISFIYVGGFLDNYNLSMFINTINKKNFFNFILCTRKDEWERFNLDINDNISIVHSSNKELKNLYKKVDVAILYIEPKEYWNFAVPIKLFEYIGERKPILASKGTLAAKFVEENGIGWSIDYNEQALNEFLDSLNREKIERLSSNLEKCAINNTWEARAKRVAEDLTGKKYENSITCSS